MEEKAETFKTNFQNKSIDDQHYQQLWLETFDYRQNFIKQSTIADIMERFPVYSNPSKVKKLQHFQYHIFTLDIDRC